MFRICLVGFGRWGKVYFETINRLDFCTIDCIVLDESSLGNEQEVGVPIFHRIEDVIGARKVDGFIIATPPDTHLNLAKICISRKLPVLVEKPYTMNFAQASQLTQIALQNNVVCMVGYQHLFAENYITLKRMVDFNSSHLEIYSEGLSNGPFRSNVSVLRDWGSHEFSMAIDLFNEIPISYALKKIAGEKNYAAKGVYLIELFFSLDRKYTSIFGNISEVKRRTLIATYPGGWAYLNGLDQSGCVVMKNGSIINPNSILSTGVKPLDLMLSQFVKHSKSEIFTFKELNNALEIVSLIDEIENKFIKENVNVNV
jgi:predicted dehydrogenase